MKFSTLSTSDQLDALFPGHASLEAAPEGDLLLRYATTESRSFIIIGFDFNVAGGSMGVANVLKSTMHLIRPERHNVTSSL